MPKVLLVAFHDPSVELGGTVLFRSDVERTRVDDPDRALPTAKACLPNMVVIKDQLPAAAERMLRALKQAPETRRASVVVLLRDGASGAEVALRKAGASLVISGPVDPLIWDDRIEELFNEPRRREVRIPVRFVVWPRAKEDAREASMLNLSVRGMLIESSEPLPLGSTVELAFQLPGGPLGEIVGQVVRLDEVEGRAQRIGIDFIILRGASRSLIEAFVLSEARL